MAVINDPSTGNDVINDTSGNDVINLIGGDDVVHLSGGNDVINTHRNSFYAYADFQQPHAQSLEINGSGLFANVGHAQLIDQIVVRSDEGLIMTAKGMGGSNPFDADYGSNDGSWIGVEKTGNYAAQGYFYGKTESLDLDFTQIANTSDNYQKNGVTLGGHATNNQEVHHLSATFGSVGGLIEAKLTHVQDVTLKAMVDANQNTISDAGSNIISSSLAIESSSVGTITADFSKTHQDAQLSIWPGFPDPGEYVESSIATLSYVGSHGNNMVETLISAQQATVATFEGNDALSINLQANGVGTINAGDGNNRVSVGGGAHVSIQTGNGNDYVKVAVNDAATVATGAGADKLIGDRITYSNNQTVIYSGSNQTIDLGASGVAQTGNVTFRINAYSSLVDGVGAHASVYAGGKKIGEFQANNNATTGQDFTITTAAANLLNGELAILFDNDAYIAATSTTPVQDRNLYIREVEMINPDGSKQALWNKTISTDKYAERPVYDRTNRGAPAGVNSAFDGQNTYAYTPYSTGTIGMAWGGALKFNLDTQVAGIDIADGGNGSDTYLFDRESGRDLYRDSGTQAGDVDVLKFAADVRPDQIWLSRDAQAKIHVGIIGTNNDAVINGIDQLQAGGKTLAAADFDKLIQAMASVTPPTMGQLDLNTTQHQKLDSVLAANWH